jgi:hypothetical protein
MLETTQHYQPWPMKEEVLVKVASFAYVQQYRIAASSPTQTVMRHCSLTTTSLFGERHDAHATVWFEAELLQPFSLQPDFRKRLVTPSAQRC